ncbi:MAG: nucleoside triphosphate pyrophosphohydrolase [Candidatus Magasanikbacteria bacterium]
MSIDKLVRDKIPEIIKEDNKTPETHEADTEELWEKLKDKLEEETQEFVEDETPQELADILEVILAICEYKMLVFLI